MARILLVDDNLALRAVLQRTLGAAGHDVMTAGNGAEAMRVLEAEPMDLVVTDLVMPDAEGLQLLRDLRSIPSPPPAIAMSGGGRGTADDYLALARRFGARETLQKPFLPSDLLAAVGRVLGPSPG